MSAKKLNCPACGAPVLLTDNQCLGCGAHLDEGRLVGASTGETPPPEDFVDVTLEPEPAAPPPPAAASPAVPYRVGAHSRPWNGPGLPGGTGFWASLTRAWAFIGQSVVLAQRNSTVLLPSLLSAAIGLVLVGVFILALLLTPGALLQTHGQHSAHEPLLDCLALCLGFVSLLITYWFTGMTADLVSATLRGQSATLAHAWREACCSGPALVWLAVVTALVNALTSSSRRQGGALGDVVAGAVDSGWRVASYLLVPIVVLEDIPLSQAFGRAIQLHNNNVIGIIVGEIGVSWLTRALTTFVLLAAAGGAYLAYLAAPVLLPLLIACCVGVLVILIAAAGYVRTAYYTCLYEWAAAHEAAGEAVPAPAPLAAAWARPSAALAPGARSG